GHPHVDEHQRVRALCARGSHHHLQALLALQRAVDLVRVLLRNSHRIAEQRALIRLQLGGGARGGQHLAEVLMDSRGVVDDQDASILLEHDVACKWRERPRSNCRTVAEPVGSNGFSAPPGCCSSAAPAAVSAWTGPTALHVAGGAGSDYCVALIKTTAA